MSKITNCHMWAARFYPAFMKYSRCHYFVTLPASIPTVIPNIIFLLVGWPSQSIRRTVAQQLSEMTAINEMMKHQVVVATGGVFGLSGASLMLIEVLLETNEDLPNVLCRSQIG